MTNILRRSLFYSALVAVDVGQSVRRSIRQKFIRYVVVASTFGLTIMLAASLMAMLAAERSIRSVRTDSLVGIEAAVSMRGLVRGVQLEFFRASPDRQNHINSKFISEFPRAFRIQLDNYGRAAYDKLDERNIISITSQFERLLELIGMISNEDPELAVHLSAAEKAAQDLVLRINSAYDYDRQRLERSTYEASQALLAALRAINLLSLALAIYTLTMFLVLFTYRWLGVLEADKS